MLKELEKISNFDALAEELQEIIKVNNLDLAQIMVQSTAADPGNLTAGAGRVYSLENTNEKDYNVLNPLFSGTILESYIKKYNGYRTRIMTMPGRHCYSVHMDPTPRIHIPIVTNEEAWMIWPYKNLCYKMLTGSVYWADTRKFHTFINGANIPRIHVVMCVDA